MHRRVFVLIIALFLLGCTQSKQKPLGHYPDARGQGVIAGAIAGATIATVATGAGVPLGLVVGGIAGGAIGSQLQSHNKLLKELASQRVQIIKVGSQVKLILPADEFFYRYSPVLKPSVYATLDDLVQFIDRFDKITVKVAGFTDNKGQKHRNLALSRQRAQNISNYFMRKSLDARILYAEGYGSGDPIASNVDAKGRAHNRRVEITFTELLA